MTMPLLTSGDLEAILQDAGVGTFALVPVCHPHAGVDVIYIGQAQLCLACHDCHQTFATLALAEGLPLGGS